MCKNAFIYITLYIFTDIPTYIKDNFRIYVYVRKGTWAFVYISMFYTFKYSQRIGVLDFKLYPSR